ncbi:MAG: hypothetical protein DMG57_13935 [Acidobacteria bacterium]|nr:MAG: hypothetical protein DMG57_13935 [Acidobacteriota bacterium]
MARKRKITQTRVTALLPYSIELTKLKSGNTLDVQVRAGDELLGTLKMGRGSVQWWPRGNRINMLWKSWHDFAEMLNRNMGRPPRGDKSAGH